MAQYPHTKFSVLTAMHFLKELLKFREWCYLFRLPVTLTDLISKKRATNYSTRTCASLIVPRFNTRYMKDSVAFRGSVLWNAVTNNCSALTKNIPYRDLRLKLKSQANFNEFSFKITSASTCNFRKDDFVYT